MIDQNGWNDDMSEAPRDGCGCHGCGALFQSDLIVPDEIWQRIKPDGARDGAGLLCPTCIMDRAVSRCGWTVGFVFPEPPVPT